MNNRKADIDLFKWGVKGSLKYFYETTIVKAVQKPTVIMIIIVIVHTHIHTYLIWYSRSIGGSL